MESEDLLKINKARFISHTTKIQCACCGEYFKINNRDKLPFEFETLNEFIGKIWIPCPNCNETYDLGICIYK